MMASSRHGVKATLRGAFQHIQGEKWQPLEQQFRSLRLTQSRTTGRRCMSTETSLTERQSFRAAREFDLDNLASQLKTVKHARAVPVSPSYFSRSPRFNDRYLGLEKLMRMYGNLPTVPAADAGRVAWMSLADIKQAWGESVKATDYANCLIILKRLHQIHPDLKPPEVTRALDEFKRDIQAFDNEPSPILIDRYGRALGVGKRKSSTARAFVVEGDGQVLVNGKTLANYFGRVHDRESAVWALHATDRMDKYNVWARVEGGGTTGQAEALTLAIAKALMAHEPALKPALRRAGCVTRDPRTVERKKHGRPKARKGPTWVKR